MSDSPEANPYLKLDRPPHLVAPDNPSCGACAVEVEHTGDDWLCPSCGTTWPPNVAEDDGSGATLYEAWSGESLAGPAIPVEHADFAAGFEGAFRAHRVEVMLGMLAQRAEREAGA